MKTLSALAAVGIALALVLSPMVAFAAGSITFTSPASGASYKGSQSYTISGTISPVPTQVDNVGIVVKNPSGTTVDVGSVPVSSGAFSYATAVGGTSAWTTGTYTITATDSYGATGSTTFTFTAVTPSVFNETAALLQIEQEIKVLNTTVNSMKAAQTNQGSTLTSIQSSLTGITSSLTSIQSSLTGITSSLTYINASLKSITSSLTTVSGGMTTLQGSITSMSNSLTSINSEVQAADTAATSAATAATNAENAVSSTQTYVLVVAVLAAITLVLVLAILVRKLS